MKDETIKFEIFRTSEALEYAETDTMELVDTTPAMLEGIEKVGSLGLEDGSQIKLLFAMPGMSLTYGWFKSHFPLPLHSHDADCVYFVIAGTLRLGNEQLGPGDGFFVGSDVPYTYHVGPDGVEILEFRTKDKFNIKIKGKTADYWEKIAAKLLEARNDWPGQGRPSELRDPLETG